MAEPIQLTPEEVAAYEKAASQAAPAAINPVRDLSADDLFNLAIEDKDNFDLITEFRRNKDLWADQNVVQKVAEVNNRIKQRGFSMSDIPGPGKVAHTVFDIAKGFGKQAWNYANALVGAPIAGAIGEITGDANNPGFTKELTNEGQRRVMENLAGTEAAMHGVARMGEKLVRKVTGANFDLTPEQKVSDLWKDVGTGDVEEDISKGQGGFLTPIGANVRQELEAAGKPVRPEEVQALAAGDPASFYTFGKAFQGVGKLVPAKVNQAVEKVVEKAGQVSERAAGKVVEATGDLVDLGGKAAKVAGPAVGFVKGAVEAGPLGALAGLKGGEIAAKVSGRVSRAGEELAEVGRQIGGKAPVTGAMTQLAKDVAGSVPTVAAEITKGVAFDIGTAALTSETPKDTQTVGIGAFFGGLGAGRRAGARIISGQIVGPRAWGIDKYIPPTGNLDPMFENMHIEATKDAAPAVKVRLNAIRQFLKGANADTDVFLAKDAAALEKVLTQSGVRPERAKEFAQQEGFFTANLPGRDGKPKRVILARNIDAAPHEAFHAIQDVLGETANQHIDQIVREEYGPQWEVEGQRYADRIAPGGDWRETILDATGKGFEYAKEKIAMAVANEYRSATGAEPPSGYVQERAKEVLGQVMDRAVQSNPNLDPNQIAQHVWRDVLSAQEATAVADSYLARELAAENFDMVFKNLGVSLNQPGLAGRLARVVASLVKTLGGEPLSPEVRSDIGQIAPRFSVTEAVRTAPSLVKAREVSAPVKPQVTPRNEPLLPSPKPLEPVKPVEAVKPVEPAKREELTPSVAEAPEGDGADDARAIAAQAPETPIAGGTKSPRELLGTVAEAIAQQAGVKINYLSAPDEPAASITSNRDARRALIETFRRMPAEARALWEKTFFPERVLKLKGDKYQVMGWAPEVFAANAHKLAEKLVELDVAAASPYAIDVNAKTFTSEGWQNLYKDVQRFVKNQMAGRTGAGEPLVVPKSVTEAGLFAPAQKASAGGLDQVKADFINMLFNFRLPSTPRVQKGKLPLNIAAQDVSAATKPGRVEIPVIPRGEFTGVEAERQGIAGRQIMEVNPLRQQIEAAAQAKGVAMPEFIEAIQRLNLESIKEVELAPEVPQFRGNTLTLSAGFQPQPKTAKGREMAEKGYQFEEFGYFGTRGIRALKDGKVVADISSAAHEKPETVDIDMVWVDEAHQRNGLGETLYRELATVLQRDGVNTITGSVISAAPLKIRRKLFGEFETERYTKVDNRVIAHVTSKVDPKAQFQPKKIEDVAMMSDEEFRQWSSNLGAGKGFTDVAAELGRQHKNPDLLLAMHDALKEQGKERVKQAIESKDLQQMENAVAFASKVQFFREAYEAAQNVGSMKDFNKSDDTKFIKSVNTSETILQNKVLDNAPEISENDRNMSTQLQPKKAAKKETRGEELVRRKMLGQVIEPIQDYGDIARFSELWVSPEGDVFNATGGGVGFNHETWARKYIMGESHWTQMFGSAAGANTAAQMAEGIAERRGWRKVYVGGKSGVRQRPGVIASAFGAPDRFVNIPKGLFVDKGLSKEQKAALEQMAIENKISIFNRGNDKVIFDPNEGGEAQFQPKKAAKKEFKMKPAKGGFSKAWILPDGTPVQLGGKWHHEFINESPELRSKYDLPVDDNTEQNRIEALKTGFVRINWADASGRLTIEAREKDWPRQREAVRNFVERNAEDISYLKVYLFDDTVSKVTNSDDVKVFEMDDIEKSAMIPFMDLGDKRATGDASDRLFQKAVDRQSSKPASKTSFSLDTNMSYWVGPKGEVILAPDGHEMKTYELNRDGVVELDLDKLAKSMDREGVQALYDEMGRRKFLRAYNVGDGIALEGPGRWEFLSRTQREAIEDAAAEQNLKVYYNNKPVESTNFPEVGAAFQPKKVAEDYAKKAGIKYTPSTERVNVPESTAKKVADFYESAAHTPDAPEVKKSYDALAKETLAQYEAIKDAGYEIEPWTGEGEPYKSSADMVKDVTENKHLYFLPTKGNFSGSEGNPMLEPSGVGDFLVNDIFRAVHDFFGHAKEGLQFGPKGEFNAWRVHSEMYSPEAQGALAAETLAQNFWVNYGKHLRREDGSVPAKGDPDFVALPDRPFAEQKNIVIPDELLQEVRAQFQPAKDEYKKLVEKMDLPIRQHYDEAAEILDSGITEFTKMEWSRIPLQTQRALIAIAKFDIPHRPKIAGAKVHQTKVRGIDLEDKPTYRETVEKLNIHPASIRPHFEAAADLLDTGVTEFTKPEWDALPMEQQKAIHEIARFEPNFPYPKITRSSGEHKLINIAKRLAAQEGRDDLTSQFQPRRGDEDLFGKQMFNPREVADMSPEEIAEFFPEAIVPSKEKESIPSAITESPLFKRAGSEEAAVKAFATKLVEFAKTKRNDPIFKAGAEWYDKFTPMLKKEFGTNADLMAELLAATSPQTNVETNFAYALDALEGFTSGRFAKVVTKFNQGMDMLANDTWRGWYSKELKNIPNPPKEPTPAAFLEHWIFKHDLKPRQSNGKLYGQHSLPVLQVFARKWLDTARGPKTLNFVENLLGKGHEATIDLWADRTMRRIGYAGQKRWRILPKNQAGVSDTDFAFAQKAFRAAAEQLGMKPDALQGALWFAEKQLWADNGWSRLDLGDFRKEMEKLPMLRRGIQERLTKTKLSGKVRSAEALELSLVQPRN